MGVRRARGHAVRPGANSLPLLLGLPVGARLCGEGLAETAELAAASFRLVGWSASLLTGWLVG